MLACQVCAASVSCGACQCSQAVLPDNLQLGKEGKLKLGSVRHFVLDECDKMLDKLGAHLGSYTLKPVRSTYNIMLLRPVA
jgi:hypothetical protein